MGDIIQLRGPIDLNTDLGRAFVVDATRAANRAPWIGKRLRRIPRAFGGEADPADALPLSSTAFTKAD